MDSILDRIKSLKEHAAPGAQKHLYGNLITLLSQGRSNKMFPVVKSVFRRKPSTILDVGCGYVALAIFFALHGMETVGIDLDCEALEAGTRLAETLGIRNVSFVAMDACEISLSGFDLALSTDFYEHLPYADQPHHLRSIYNALNPGGVYIIRAPHRSNIRQHREGHIGLPSFTGLRKQAAEAGFTVKFSIAHSGRFSAWSYHPALERWIENKSWEPKTIYKTLQKCGLANVIAELGKA